MKKFERRMKPAEKQMMRQLYEENYALGFIARKFNCCVNTVWNNVFDISVSCLSKEKIKCTIKTSKVTPKEVKKIRLFAKNGQNAVQLSKLYGISQTATLSIIRGRTFRWIPGWIRPYQNQKFFYYKPINIKQEKPKTDKKPGAKLGVKKVSSRGEVLRLAKKYNVSSSTICRWRKKGKI
jgi:hypothetical protein